MSSCSTPVCVEIPVDPATLPAPVPRPDRTAGGPDLPGRTVRIDDDTMHAHGRIVTGEAAAGARLSREEPVTSTTLPSGDR